VCASVATLAAVVVSWPMCRGGRPRAAVAAVAAALPLHAEQAAETATVTIREAQDPSDAEFIVALLLEAGRDASDDDLSPFGLRSLVNSACFQRCQLDSSLKKVDKTRQQRAVAAQDRRCCLWIAEDATTGERVGSVGVMEASPAGQVKVAALDGVESCQQLGELTSFYVARSHRRQGLGTRLLRHAMEWAAAQGYDTLVLWVWRQLVAARSLYRKQGFVVREQSFSPADPESDDVMVTSLLRGDGCTVRKQGDTECHLESST
jgi:ribosomal protein S18 acetylase RimI-like enzyme